MDRHTESHTTLHLDDVPRLDLGDFTWRPVRRALGITAFGVNGYTAPRAGGELIEEHDETSAGAGRHEELYLVVEGHARFEVADDVIDAPRGQLVLVPVGVRRSATAVADDTTVLAIGGPPGTALPPSAFEYWYAAEPAYRAGDYARAIAVASEGLEHHPTHCPLNYELARFHALAGHREQALEHLRLAAVNPRWTEWAADDDDLDSIRSHPDFPTQ